MEEFIPIEKVYWTKEDILKMVDDAPDIDRVGEYIKETLNTRRSSQ